MKHFAGFLAVIFAAVMAFSACSRTDGRSAAEISESAMNNFLSKVEAGNYVVDANNYLKTNVFSDDLVTFDYVNDDHSDFTVMAVDGEVFQGYLTQNGVEEVAFLGEGSATDMAKARLLNYWTSEEASQGNIYNLFYNSQEDPLTFVSYEDAVKKSVASFAGYGASALRLMHEVYLVLDSENPSSAHLTAVVDDDQVARVFYDDIDITITFGAGQKDERAQSWMDVPVYPAARSGWTDSDVFVLDSVFLPGYGETSVPFPSFASYAMKLDEENFVMSDEVNIRDSHATIADMETYIKTLMSRGFHEVKVLDEDGSERTFYRLLIRQKYDCYSSIELVYDDGINITARKYYDFPVYTDLDKINKVITEQGFAPLDSSEVFKTLEGTDTSMELTESWLYFFNYDLTLFVNMDFDDLEKAEGYIADYQKSLAEAGFDPVYADDTEEIDRYEAEDGSSFKYNFLDGDTLSMLFKSERAIDSKGADKLLKRAGFPVPGVPDPITCRDLTAFEKAQYGIDYRLFLAISKNFKDLAEAEEFLNDYEKILNDAGFDRVNPSEVGSLKTIALYNEEKGKLVAFDLFDQEDGTIVNFDFRAE
jgi:hypothetical protein